MKRFKIICLLLIAVLLITFLFFYLNRRWLSFFAKGPIERILSQRIGADVAVGSVSGALFKGAVLHDVECGWGELTLNFDKVYLEYPLWDIVTKKMPIGGEKNLTVVLERGSLILKDNPLISKKINGVVRLLPDKIIVTALALELFDTSTRLNMEGSLRSINFKGTFNRREGLEILLNGRSILSDSILKFESKVDFKGPKADRVETLLMDAEIDTGKRSFRAFLAVQESINGATARNQSGESFIGGVWFLTPSRGRIMVNGDYSEWPLLTADIESSHIDVSGLDFTNIAHLSSKFLFLQEGSSIATLDIYTESTVINYRPFDESELSCSIDKDKVRLIYLKIGDSISASGALGLKSSPPVISLQISLRGLDVSPIFLIFDEAMASAVSGEVSGDINIEGSLYRPETKVSLSAHDGHIGTVDYESMILNMKGRGPLLTISDSRLIRENSFLTMEGVVDLRELGKERFMEDISLKTDENTIIWDGWDISKAANNRELTLKKALGKGVRVGFKKYMSDETEYQAVEPQDELELEYHLEDTNGALQFKTREKEEFLGVMKKYKF